MSHNTCIGGRTRVPWPRHCGGVQHGRHGRQLPVWRTQELNHRRACVITNALKGVLCDLDGVMYESGTKTVIPGAVETITYFRDRQVPLLFVTNTSTKNREGLAQRLRAMGIPSTSDDIVSPAKLAADWLRIHGSGPAALFVAPDLTAEFEGIPLLHPTAESGAGAVVIGDMGLDWNYRELNRAFRLVMEGQMRAEAIGMSSLDEVQLRSLDILATWDITTGAGSSTATDGATGGATGGAEAGAGGAGHDCQVQLPHLGPNQQQQQVGSPRPTPCASPLASVGDGAASAGLPAGPVGSFSLISLGKARYYKDTDGYSIDVGPFTAAIEFAADIKAMVLGKPDPLIFRLAAQSLGLLPEEVVMIGDDVKGDVAGAQAAGLRGVLVRTGKFRERDLSVGVRPDGVLRSVADLPAWWEGQERRGEQEEEEQERRQQTQEQEQLPAQAPQQQQYQQQQQQPLLQQAASQAQVQPGSGSGRQSGLAAGPWPSALAVTGGG